MIKIVSKILQSCKKILISIIQRISTILYLTDKDNPSRLLNTFPLNDILLFVVCVIISLIFLPFLFKKNPDLEKNKIFGNNDTVKDMEQSVLKDDANGILENSSNIEL